MPFPTIPPVTIPPSNPTLEQNNTNNVTPQQNQYVTPSETNTTSNQSQESVSNGTAVNNNYTNPNIYGQSTNVNSQVNTGYGENSQECMENVGCRTVPAVDFVAYYGNNNLSNKVDGLVNSYGNNNSYGAAVRLVVPIGSGFKGNLDKAAAEELQKRIAETRLLQQRLIADSITLDEQIVKGCVNLKNTVNGKSITIDRPNASPVVARAYDLCKGLDIVIASAPPTNNNDLAAENAFLRQKIEQLLKQGVPQKIGN